MERPKCKLCSRVFLNGRALGGHMRSHLATLPLPPNKILHQRLILPHGDEAESKSESNSSSSDSVSKRKALDPELLDAGSGVIQDRESETELTQIPTRKRPNKASPKSLGQEECKSNKSHSVELTKSESVTESTQVSSISEVSQQDEEVAFCLMMLSRDVWVKVVRDENDSAESKARLTREARLKRLNCRKVNRRREAVGNKASSKKRLQEMNSSKDEKIYECPFCYKVFGSGQALGGHKRSHLIMGSSIASNAIAANSPNLVDTILDLNSPAPLI